jgi:hypothetical protein
MPYARNAESSEGEHCIVVRGFQHDIAILDQDCIEESMEIGSRPNEKQPRYREYLIYSAWVSIVCNVSARRRAQGTVKPSDNEIGKHGASKPAAAGRRGVQAL